MTFMRPPHRPQARTSNLKMRLRSEAQVLAGAVDAVADVAVSIDVAALQLAAAVTPWP